MPKNRQQFIYNGCSTRLLKEKKGYAENYHRLFTGKRAPGSHNK